MASSLNDIDHETIVKWVDKLHTVTAKIDAKFWLDTMTTQDMSVKFYGQPDVRGRENVEPVFIGFFSRLDAMTHDVQQTDWAPPRIYHQCRVHYSLKRKDGVKDVVSLDVQCVYFIRKADGELRCYRMEIFGDPSELNAKLALAA